MGESLAHDEAGDLGARRLDVLAVDAVVADVGVRHRDDLAGVGGVGQHLLVAAERGVEDHLAGGLARRGRSRALRRRCRPRGPVVRAGLLVIVGLGARRLACSADEPDLGERPEAEERLPVDVLLGDLAPAAAVVAAVPVVAEHVVVPLRHLDRGIGLVVPELAAQVALLDQSPVDEERTRGAARPCPRGGRPRA